MEVKLIDTVKRKGKFEVYGVDNILMNLLRDELAKDKEVDFVTYSQPHPLLDGYVLTVKADNPGKEVKKALAGLKSEVKGMKSAFKSAK
jgi:DNA-directed RNA polymerase subunit L